MARHESNGHPDGAAAGITGLRRAPRTRRLRCSHPAAADRLAGLWAELDRRDAPFSRAHLIEELRRLTISADDLGPYVRFGRFAYRRNEIHRGLTYQALVLCWRSGQRSPIHDHRGSACAVRVIEGIAAETVFERSPCGLVYPTHSLWHAAGSVSGKSDDDIHQMGNLQPTGQDLITLHVYSPMLTKMRVYTLGDSVGGENRSAARVSKASPGRVARRRRGSPSLRYGIRLRERPVKTGIREDRTPQTPLAPRA
jgi:cysteine dioxygenase